jgi:hypothetical protein
MRFMHRDVLLEIYAALPVKFQDMVYLPATRTANRRAFESGRRGQATPLNLISQRCC